MRHLFSSFSRSGYLRALISRYNFCLVERVIASRGCVSSLPTSYFFANSGSICCILSVRESPPIVPAQCEPLGRGHKTSRCFFTLEYEFYHLLLGMTQSYDVRFSGHSCRTVYQSSISLCWLHNECIFPSLFL